VLGVGVHRSHHPPRATALVRNVETILDDDDLRIGSAGLLRGGAQGWVQIETEATQCVEGVEHRPFLTAATSMDGSIATTYGVGTQVVVCDNTLSVALGSFASSVKVRHSSKSLGRLGDVRDALQLVIGAGDAFGAQVRELIAQPVSESRFERFLTATRPSRRQSPRSASRFPSASVSARLLSAGPAVHAATRRSRAPDNRT
jgi:phage/plasmid-like protein (TIGR03299 family)